MNFLLHPTNTFTKLIKTISDIDKIFCFDTIVYASARAIFQIFWGHAWTVAIDNIFFRLYNKYYNPLLSIKLNKFKIYFVRPRFSLVVYHFWHKNLVRLYQIACNDFIGNVKITTLIESIKVFHNVRQRPFFLSNQRPL